MSGLFKDALAAASRRTSPGRMRMTKEHVSLAGEYAVAAELCRRGVYAQLTLGHHKRTDLLVEAGTTMLAISVKAKQRNDWPHVAQVLRPDEYLVLVDFQHKEDTERPDFYVLNSDDWDKLLDDFVQGAKNAKRDPTYGVVFSDGWKGVNVKQKMVVESRERWDKISAEGVES